MESFIAQDVIKRLKFDYDFKKENNGWLQGGTCPSCGKKELFVFASKTLGGEVRPGEQLRHRAKYKRALPGYFRRFQ